MNINQYRVYLPESIFNHFSNYILSREREEYFSASIWEAVFLEAFLDELMMLEILRKYLA